MQRIQSHIIIKVKEDSPIEHTLEAIGEYVKPEPDRLGASSRTRDVNLFLKVYATAPGGGATKADIPRNECGEDILV